jgi:hypothetical protein
MPIAMKRKRGAGEEAVAEAVAEAVEEAVEEKADGAGAVFAPPLGAYAAAFARGGFSTMTALIRADADELEAFASLVGAMDAAHARVLRARIADAADRAREAFCAEIEAIQREADPDEAEAEEALRCDETIAGIEAAWPAEGATDHLEALRSLARRVAEKESALASLVLARVLKPFSLVPLASPPRVVCRRRRTRPRWRCAPSSARSRPRSPRCSTRRASRTSSPPSKKLKRPCAAQAPPRPRAGSALAPPRP